MRRKIHLCTLQAKGKGEPLLQVQGNFRKTRLSGLVSRQISYSSMKIVIANLIFNVAVLRFPHRQEVSVGCGQKKNVYLWPTRTLFIPVIMYLWGRRRLSARTHVRTYVHYVPLLA